MRDVSAGDVGQFAGVAVIIGNHRGGPAGHRLGAPLLVERNGLQRGIDSLNASRGAGTGECRLAFADAVVWLTPGRMLECDNAMASVRQMSHRQGEVGGLVAADLRKRQGAGEIECHGWEAFADNATHQIVAEWLHQEGAINALIREEPIPIGGTQGRDEQQAPAGGFQGTGQPIEHVGIHATGMGSGTLRDQPDIAEVSPGSCGTPGIGCPTQARSRCPDA